MHQLTIGSLPLPKLYVVDNRVDVEKCKSNGIPYIVWHGSDEMLIKIVMLPTLKKLFPYIKWEQHLGISGKKKQVIVSVPEVERDQKEMPVDMDAPDDNDVDEDELSTYDDDGYSGIAEEYRTFGDVERKAHIEMTKLDDFVGDMSAFVNIEELQALHMLPSFLDDIATCIRKNLYNMEWIEGYNKKRGLPIGNFNSGNEAGNLIILDISGSIPRGIAATMLSLIDTLRSSANADLIITASISKYYPIGTELPSPEDLRKEFKPGNEARMFNEILRTKIKGRTLGNVISFGDNDCPSRWCRFRGEQDITENDLTGTKVNRVMHFHTSYTKPTGYALWADNLCDARNVSINTSWCSIIYDNYGR